MFIPSDQDHSPFIPGQVDCDAVRGGVPVLDIAQEAYEDVDDSDPAHALVEHTKHTHKVSGCGHRVL